MPHCTPRIGPSDPSHLANVKTRVMISMMTSPSTAVSGVGCTTSSDVEIAEKQPGSVIHGFGPLWKDFTIERISTGGELKCVGFNFKEAILYIPGTENIGEMIAHLSGLARRCWMQTLETRHRRTFKNWATNQKDNGKLSQKQWRPTRADHSNILIRVKQWIRPGFHPWDLNFWSEQLSKQMQDYIESIGDEMLPSKKSDRSWWLAANYELTNDWWRRFASNHKYPLMCFAPKADEVPRFRESTRYYGWNSRYSYKYPIEHYICRALRSRRVRGNFPFTIRTGSLRALQESEKAEKEHGTFEQMPSQLDFKEMWMKISELPETADVTPVVVISRANDFCRALGEYLSKTSCARLPRKRRYTSESTYSNSELASKSLGDLEGVSAMKFDTGFDDGFASDQHSPH